MDALHFLPASPMLKHGADVGSMHAAVRRAEGTLRRELVDHVIALGKRHLLRLVRQHVAYYNEDRAHVSLDCDAPVARRPTAERWQGRRASARRRAAPLLFEGCVTAERVLATTASKTRVVA